MESTGNLSADLHNNVSLMLSLQITDKNQLTWCTCGCTSTSIKCQVSSFKCQAFHQTIATAQYAIIYEYLTPRISLCPARIFCLNTALWVSTLPDHAFFHLMQWPRSTRTSHFYVMPHVFRPAANCQRYGPQLLVPAACRLQAPSLRVCLLHPSRRYCWQPF